MIQTTRYENIDIIPGNGYLMQTDMMLLMRNEDENRIMRLRDALIEVSGAYDYCICDCGRLFDMVVVNRNSRKLIPTTFALIYFNQS